MEVPTKRSVRAIPPTYAPSLVITHGKKYRDQTFCIISDGCYHVRSIPEMRGMRCIASCYGWLILQNYYSRECYLFNPSSLENILLPPTIQYINIGLLMYPPSDPKCVVLLASSNRNSYIFCRIGDKIWTKRDLVFKNGKYKPVPLHALSCKGKIYLFFFERVMVVIDVHDTFLSTKLHDVENPEFSLPFVRRSFYVESCGDIFQVVGLHIGITTTVQTFDVFKLDLSTLDWVKMESLGDRIFLLGESCISLSAAELGVQGNCIYFTCYTRLYRFDMDDGTTTITLPCTRKFSYWDGPFWVVPNCKPLVKKEVAKLEKSKEEVIKESWNDLPAELLELILSSLFLGDCIRFRLACKSWISITPPMRSNPPLTQCESRCQQLPWLMSFPKNKNVDCVFYHPIYGDAYTMNIPELAGAVVRDARHGWLLMSFGESSIFFINPSTLETIKLPDISHSFVGISFSAPPTSSDCIVFGHRDSTRNFVRFCLYLTGEDDWCNECIAHEEPNEFLTANCNPVFYDGVFYCLGKDGKLGCLQIEDGACKWSVLPVPAIIPWSPSTLFSVLMSSEWQFLVEYNGEILSVFVGFEGQHVRVYKLDQSKMRWVGVTSLGDKVLFLSQIASILVPAGLKGKENRIYFPRFHGKDNVFYSLSSGNYHCFGSKHSRQDWIDTSGNLESTWIQFKK